MSRQIPIYLEPGYEYDPQRSSDSVSEDTRPRRFKNTDSFEKDFEDASKRFFGKNFRRRHSEFPADHSTQESDFRSHSPPIYHDRPFRRGSNPSIFSCGSPSYRRNHFDEMIQRMMNEDSADSFDFPDPEFGNFHVKKTDKYHSPEGSRKMKHEKITKSPSAPVSEKRKQRGNFERQSSNPSKASNYNVDDEGFVDIPVVICKDDKGGEKMGKNKSEQPENLPVQEESVTQEQLNEEVPVLSERNDKETNEKEKNDECDPELTVKISVENKEENSGEYDEEKAKVDEKDEEKDLESQEIKNEQQTREQAKEEKEMPQGSQQDAQLSKIKTTEAELEKVLEKVKAFEATGSAENNKEYLWLEELLMRILMRLDAIEASGSKKIREARKAVVKRVQIGLNELEKKSVSSSS